MNKDGGNCLRLLLRLEVLKRVLGGRGEADRWWTLEELGPWGPGPRYEWPVI